LEVGLRSCEEVGTILSLASVEELAIPKPGNASRSADAAGASFEELLKSSVILTPQYVEACERGKLRSRPIMDLLYRAVEISSRLNFRFQLLGTALTLIPIAYAYGEIKDLSELLPKAWEVVRSLNHEDYRWFASCLSTLNPGYLGKMDRADFRQFKGTLWEALALSADVDSVARNLITGYSITRRALKFMSITVDTQAILKSFLAILSEEPDGLIHRKFGAKVALDVSNLARFFLESLSFEELGFLDRVLRNKGVNPGSTADIIASAIALRLLGVIET